MHCSGDHTVANCPDLSDEQVGQLLVQLKEAGATSEDLQANCENGGMLQQTSVANSMLNHNYLYVDTCTSDDQMVNPTVLSKIHKVAKPLKLHTNAGSASINKKGYLGNTLF